MESNKNFKDTLLMGVTDFPMRGNLGQNEPIIQERWESSHLYDLLRKKNEGRPLYVLHDGPPYANGSIHAGTALNKVLKDFVLRYKNMSGFDAPYIPGWDTHGLPIENALSKDKKVNRKEIDIPKFRELCKEFALEQVEIQKKQFRRLGILGEWDHPYITLDHGYEAAQIRMFGEMVEKGLIYKGKKPVYWSPSSESALAEAEIEYYDVTSPSIYVAMPSKSTKNMFPKNTEFLIWTTTPWTIPANLAIAVGPEIEYSLIKVDNDRLFVVARSRIETLTTVLGFNNVEVIQTVFGWELEGMTYEHPLYKNQISRLILGDHVTTEDGSGLVHTAPGHGEDDFIVGQKNGLEVYCPVDSKGIMMPEAGERFAGLFVDDCNGEVIKALEEKNALLKVLTIKHSYPHDWRTKKPVIFRATPQWFASIEDLKDDILKAIQEVKWYPSWGDIRLGNMIKDRGSWCISRQRTWGVPIPAFYTEKGTPILEKSIIDHVAQIVLEEGTNAWFKKSAAELLPVNYTHPDSPNNIFVKETDIMDVWFDSGSSHHGALIERGLPYPADLYLEGSDQYHGWFNSSVITGVATMGKSPYKTLVSHGFILDAEGRKMSKSLGNVVDPNKISNTLGSDIFRLWVASVDYQADVRLGDDLLKQVAESYRKVRNTFKFMLGNLFDFDQSKDMVPYEQLSEIDQYILAKTVRLQNEAINAYDEFHFDDVYRKVNNFVNFVSSFYLDFTKDILYIEKADSLIRRSVQTVIYSVFDALLKILTPLIPHTTSEAYLYLLHKEVSDVYLLDFPKWKEYDQTIEKQYDAFMDLREVVLKALENAREEKLIGKSLNAKVVLYPKGKWVDFINSFHVNFAQVMITSEFEIKNEGFGHFEADDLTVDVFAAEGETCSRCWQVVKKLDEEELCPRCHEIIHH